MPPLVTMALHLRIALPCAACMFLAADALAGEAPFLAGMGKAELAMRYDGVGMYGYGRVGNTVHGAATPLHARSLWVRTTDRSQDLVFVSCEVAFITPNVKDTVMARLQAWEGGRALTEADVMLTATHTHAAPGGFSLDPLFNISTGGYHCGVFEGLVNGIVASVKNAHAALAPALLSYSTGTFPEEMDVAWNRALKAHLRNPEADGTLDRRHTHQAMDRTMHALHVKDMEGTLRGAVHWFGVHATCVDNRNTLISADNKGHAARLMEETFPGVVTIHAQAKAGDVSPNYHGSNGGQRRAQRRYRRKDHGHAHAERNGSLHHELAMAIHHTGDGGTLAPFLASTLRYVAMDHQQVAPDLVGGRTEVHTAPACYGQAFTQGTPVDGKGAPRWLLDLAWTFTFKRERYQGKAARELCAQHAPKRIVINAKAGTMMGKAPERSLPIRMAFPDLKRQAPGLRDQPLLGTIVPVQLMRIGDLCVVGLPGEITTIAGYRLEQDLLKTLAPQGVRHVVIASYANAYIGYVTTPEEYAAQTYEGGHTLFGPWELPAFITAFRELAPHLSSPAREAPASFSDRWPRYDTTGLQHRSFPGSCIVAPEP